MKKKYEPIVYRVYDYISTNCQGKENAVSGRDLAAIFYPTLSEDNGRRTVRLTINTIRNSDVFDNVIASGNEGYWWATKEDVREANKRLFSQAFSLLEVARANQQKISKNGQAMIQLTPYQREVFNSLCEVER